MNYIVLDLEWNQPFTPKHIKRKPFPLTGEIIQIGAVKLDNDFNIIDNFKIGVRPKYYTILQKHVSKVVNLKQDDIYLGFSFPVAFDYFKKWCQKDFIFLTWGFDDIPMLKENMCLHSIKTADIPIGYNIQLIFNNQTNGDNRQRSLTDALKYFNIEQIKEAHDALNDAYYTAKICGYLDLTRGIAEYIEPEHFNVKQEHCLKNKGEALPDRIREITCPICRKPIMYERWIKPSGSKMITLANCSEHGDFYARIKLTKISEDKTYVSKMLYRATKELRDYYGEKYQKTRKENY